MEKEIHSFQSESLNIVSLIKNEKWPYSLILTEGKNKSNLSVNVLYYTTTAIVKYVFELFFKKHISRYFKETPS